MSSLVVLRFSNNDDIFNETEVKCLQLELESANCENYELKNSLESCKRSEEEINYQLKILTKKSKESESQLEEKRDALMKIQLQYKMATTEAQSVKETLQEVCKQKAELLRKVEALENKEKTDSTYHDQILKRQKQLKENICEIQESFGKMEKEYSELQAISKQSKLDEDSLKKCNVLMKINKSLKDEKEKYEHLYIQIKAKCDQFEELMSLQPVMFENDLFSKAIFHQWEKSRLYYTGELCAKNEIISTLTDSLNKERSNTYKLILQNDELTEKNRDIERKLKDVEKSQAKNKEE